MGKRKQLFVLGIFCLLLLGLGVFGFTEPEMIRRRIPFPLTPLHIFLASIAFYSSGLVGFITIFIVSVKNTRWFQRRFGEFENRGEKTTTKQKYLNAILVVIAAVCPVIWFLSLKAAMGGIRFLPGLDKLSGMLILFLLIAAGPIGCAAVSTVVVFNQRRFRGGRMWLGITLLPILLLLMLWNIAVIYPNCWLALEFLHKVFHVHIK